jgi:hypothetical protein
VLRKIFLPKNDEDGSCRKLYNDEIHSLYSSPNIVRVIKSRRMRWVRHVACMGEGRGVYRVYGDRWGELDSAGSGRGPVVGFCKHGNEPLGSIQKAGYCLTS